MLILLSHHGPHSAFEGWYQIPAKQLAKLIHRPVTWFWGHEHRLAIYEKFSVKEGIEAYGRCIGPVSYTHLDVYKRQIHR